LTSREASGHQDTTGLYRQPGSEDLETSRTGIKTDYDVLHVSEGHFRGYAPDQDVHDKSEIGTLLHDCWPCRGYSRAPLVDRKTGALLGLHSSWDHETGMRRGVGLEAIKEFPIIHALDGKFDVPEDMKHCRVEEESESRPIVLTL